MSKEYHQDYRKKNRNQLNIKACYYRVLLSDDITVYRIVQRELYRNKLRAYDKKRNQTEKRKQYNRSHAKISRTRQFRLAKLRRYGKIKYNILQNEVFLAYSNGVPQCACCGELHREFLCIDHIIPVKHTNHKRLGGVFLLRYLKKNNFPEGFQLLCFNCNMNKNTSGFCKHQILKINKYISNNKKYQNKIKQLVFSYYCKGDIKCQCCGEKDIDFLVIDHINGRNKYNHGIGFGGYRINLWLRRNNYPKNFRVLCSNCNSYLGVRTQGEKCIHELENDEKNKMNNISHFLSTI